MTLPGGNLLSSKPMKRHKREIGNRNHKKLDKTGVKSHQMQTILPSIIYITTVLVRLNPETHKQGTFATLLDCSTEPVSKTLLSNTPHSLLQYIEK